MGQASGTLEQGTGVRGGHPVAAPREGAVSVDGARLRYWERGAGPTVLYVHGSGDYSDFFARTAAEVGGSLRSIAYDRRGFGGSEQSLASGLHEHVEDTAALLRELGAAPATVVGSSAGGVLALGLAVEHPELVSALVLAEPTFQPSLVPSAASTAALTRVYVRRWLLRDEEGAALSLYRWVTSYRTGGSQVDSYPEEWKRAGVAHASAALREVIQLMRPWPPARAVRSIRVPVTLVVGDIGQPFFHKTSERAHRLLPDARVVRVSDSAHILATDRPDALAEAVAATAASTRRRD